MEKIKIRYKVERKSSHSKYYLVMKCLVTESNFERGGHYSAIDIESRPLSYEEAHAFCHRLNEEQIKKEEAEEVAENQK